MNKEENRIFNTAVLIIFLSYVCSCGSKKTITETITEYVHDTVMVHKTDTVKEIKLKVDSFIDWKYLTIYDTVFHERESELVLNERGDTLKQKEKENLWHKTHENDVTQHSESHTDSIAYYKAENERLRHALIKEQSKEKIVKKGIQVPWWAWILTPLILVLGIGFLAKKLVEKKWHIT